MRGPYHVLVPERRNGCYPSGSNVERACRGGELYPRVLDLYREAGVAGRVQLWRGRTRVHLWYE